MPFLGDGLGFRRGNVTGVYLHGLFDDTAFRRAFLGELGVSSSDTDAADALDRTLDTLADHVAEHLDMDAVDKAVFGEKRSRPGKSRLVLVTGGARSGKSHYAERLTAHFARGESVLYLATLEALDDELLRRVGTHRARRPVGWRTLEAPLSPAAALREAPEKVVLLDCLSGFVSNLVLQHETEGEEVVLGAVTNAVTELLGVAKRSSKVVVIVTNEVGSGVVPPYPLGRLFRDALGAANARVAAAADAVSFCVVGLPQTLKGEFPEVALEP